jgi:hypothetical protein
LLSAIAEDIVALCAALVVGTAHLGLHGFVGGLLDGLLGLGDSLESEEVFSLLLIELLLNVADSPCDPGDNDVLQGVHTPVGDLDALVQGQELSLEGGDLDEHLQQALEPVLALLDGLATTRKTQDGPGVASLLGAVASEHEGRQVHTSHILGVNGETHGSLGLDLVLHTLGEITSGEVSLGHGQHAGGVVLAHALLGCHDPLDDVVELLLEGIGFLFE